MICLDMDMPRNCGECRFEVFEKCCVTDRNVLTTYINLFRPEWCPLRKVSEKDEED